MPKLVRVWFVHKCFISARDLVTLYVHQRIHMILIFFPRFINARRRIVQPMIDQSNRAGKAAVHSVFSQKRETDYVSEEPNQRQLREEIALLAVTVLFFLFLSQ